MEKVLPIMTWIIFVLAAGGLVLWIRKYIEWHKGVHAPTRECPSCHGETNYLTLGGNCQDCEWEKIDIREKKSTSG